MARHFPDFLSAYLDYTSGHEATERCHLWSAISCVGAALERKTWMNRGYYTLFPNLYVFLIGQSGLIKKSTTTAVAVNLLRDLPHLKMMSERLTAAALVGKMEASQKTFLYNEKTVKQSSVFAYASELSVFLVEVWGSIVELLTTYYDCQPNDSSKPWISETKGGGLTRVYGPCLNILGASTKTWLRKCIPASEMEGGFSSRVIFVVENRPPRKLVPWPSVPREMEEKRKKLSEDLLSIYQMIGEFKVTKGAYDFFSSWYEHHMTEVVPLSYEPRFNGYLGRKGDLILKLSMIRSVTLRETLEIHPEDVLWAAEQLELLEPDMKDAFRDENMEPERLGLPYEILKYIEVRGEVPHNDIISKFIVQSAADNLRRYLDTMLQQGVIERVDKIEGASKTILYRARGG